MNFETLEKISFAISSGDFDAVLDSINAAIVFEKENGAGKHWLRDLSKLADVVLTGRPAFSIFSENGNEKEPFLSFGSLPGRGHCPGAGDCLEFCYSFKAWRYPAAFCKQAQNSILLQSVSGRVSISAELARILKKPKNLRKKFVDFRLYVDGDFSNVSDCHFWFSILAWTPKLRAYGYSKSWHELLGYSVVADIPKNYRLNLSSGSVHGNDIKKEMLKLSAVRGEFVAVSVGEKINSKMHGDKNHQKRLRAVYGKKAFTCPGKCGECTPAGHACGSDRFDNVDIIIAVH